MARPTKYRAGEDYKRVSNIRYRRGRPNVHERSCPPAMSALSSRLCLSKRPLRAIIIRSPPN